MKIFEKNTNWCRYLERTQTDEDIWKEHKLMKIFRKNTNRWRYLKRNTNGWRYLKRTQTDVDIWKEYKLMKIFDKNTNWWRYLKKIMTKVLKRFWFHGHFAKLSSNMLHLPDMLLLDQNFSIFLSPWLVTIMVRTTMTTTRARMARMTAAR